MRVIDETGKNLGILEISEALRIAGERGFELIEIAPTARPPVCKIMDSGKFKYEHERRERQQSKKIKKIEVKGIRFGITTGKHDLELRAKQIQNFLEEGNKVKIEMKLRGREKSLTEFVFKKFNEFLKSISVEFVLEAPPRRFPGGIAAVISKAPNQKH
ncbi:MAG: translation initiation factor IF-3 [Candidatus Colwellbacteria bacterium]|nr:translation initiation factor IF-3 [Candidatus Colwellbacteria bacterium]